MQNIVANIQTPCSGYVCDGMRATDYDGQLRFDIANGITVISTQDPYYLLATLMGACNGPPRMYEGYQATLLEDPTRICLIADLEPLFPDDYSPKRYLQMICRRMGRCDLVYSVQYTDQLLSLFGLEEVGDLRLRQLDAAERLLLLVAGAIAARRTFIVIGRSTSDTELTAKDYNQRIMPILQQVANNKDLAIVMILGDLTIGGYDQLVCLQEVQ